MSIKLYDVYFYSQSTLGLGQCCFQADDIAIERGNLVLYRTRKTGNHDDPDLQEIAQFNAAQWVYYSVRVLEDADYEVDAVLRTSANRSVE